jgi:hypothetical protein
MSYFKRGGIHFVKVGRLGFNFYVKRRAPRVPSHLFTLIDRGIADIVLTSELSQ